MTGREAIDLLKREHAKITDAEPTSLYGISLEAIINDLEVLEIIKENHFEIDRDGNVYVGNVCDVLLGIEDYYKDMEEEYNKIKEWLKKDR